MSLGGLYCPFSDNTIWNSYGHPSVTEADRNVRSAWLLSEQQNISMSRNPLS